jgi:hypothetical protein
MKVMSIHTIMYKISRLTCSYPLSVFYEAICPDCVNFLKEQLVPTHKALGKYINLNFVAFGKARQWYSNDSYQFECQNETKQCFFYFVYACAMNVFHEPADIFNYVACLMTEVTPTDATVATYPVDSCETGLELDKVKKCANGKDDLRFLSKMRNKTSNLFPHLLGVPAVAINNTLSLEQQKDALTKLKFVICSLLKASNSNPTDCVSSSVTAVSSILLLALELLFLTTTAS